MLSASGIQSVLRTQRRYDIRDDSSANTALENARSCFSRGEYLEGIDLFEQLIEVAPGHSNELLAELYDHYQALPDSDNRYLLYVARYFDFRIQPDERVLDIGSGNNPFPLATHLADFAPDDNGYGRAGAPLKQISGKPFFQVNVEQTSFDDKYFDFVYCSHVLEHTIDPARACCELMRIAKRGYIETPTKAKDLWLNTAKVSNHNWYVELEGGTLAFSPYDDSEKNGLGCNLLLDMHVTPQTRREKAFSALVLVKSSLLNTMLYWEDRFEFEVRR